MKASVRRLNLSDLKLKALTERERYVFALTGHVFNELMLLQKLIHVSRHPVGGENPTKDASLAVSLFFLRMLTAKTHEALKILKKDSIRTVLVTDYFNHVEGLIVKWDERCKNSLTWLAQIRNKGAFHYLNDAQWGPEITDNLCEGAYVYIGKKYSDTYFHWAEIVAGLPMMKKVNEAEPLDGLETMIAKLGELLGGLNDCLALGLQAFMKKRLIDDNALEPPVSFEAPHFENFHLPYFFATS